MKEWEVKVRGIRGLIWDVPKKELMEEIRRLKEKEVEEWHQANWKRKADYDDKENLLVPPIWIEKSIVTASTQLGMIPYYAKSKKERYTKYLSNVTVHSVSSPGKLSEVKKIETALRRKDGALVWTVRPILDKWEISYKVSDPFGKMKKEEIEEIIEYAGEMIGIGAYRKGKFGRSEVIDIKENERKRKQGR